MRQVRLVLPALLLIALSFSVSAQQLVPQQAATATPPATIPTVDPQTLAVLANARASLGSAVSAQITDSVTLAIVTNSALPNSPQSNVTIKTKGTDMARWEGSTDKGTSVVVANHGAQHHMTGNGWITMGSANAIHQRMLHLPGLMIGQEIARGDLAGVYVAAETLNNRPVHHIRLSRVASYKTGIDDRLTKNSEIEVFIDTQTGLIAKVSYIHLTETDWRRGVPVEIYFDDYRPVQGMMIPFHQRTVFNHGNVSDMMITSVQFNTGLADTEFQGR